MKFTYKSEAELQAMDEAQRDAYATDKREFEAQATKDEIAKAIKESKEELEKELAKSNKRVEELAGEITSIKENNVVMTGSDSALIKEISEKKEVLKSIAKGGSEETVLKAASNRASIANNQQAVDLTDIGQLAHRKLSLYDIFPKVKVSDKNNNGTIRYYDWDEATVVRAAAARAEGAAFPESTAKFKKGSVVIEKIGDSLPVTEEFFEDEEMFASELELFLNTNVDLVVDDQLCNGTGASNTLVGLYQSSPAYVPVASGITDANIFDLAVKVAEDITVTGGSKYNPDTIIARRSVINQMKLKKDGQNNYIMPSFVSADGRTVDNMVVVESNVAPANTMIVCDRRFAKIYEKTGVDISKGMVNNQFLEDAMTLKARKRLAFLIREADKGAFRKVTSISAALVTLAS